MLLSTPEQVRSVICVGTVITELALLGVIVANDGGSFEKFNPGVLASILWGSDPIE